MEKTIDLIMEEAKGSIAKVINDSGLPPYLLLYTLKDIYNECSILAQNQLQKNQKQYESSPESELQTRKEDSNDNK